MGDVTDRLKLPLLAVAQAAKEMTHNEALTTLDLAAQAVVQAGPGDTPPPAPAIGQCWIVGAAPTGAWSGQAGSLAGWTAGGWRFVAPFEGMQVWSVADGATLRRAGGAWAVGQATGRSFSVDGVQVIAARQAAVATPTGGTVVDVEARAALAALLARLRAHGLIA